MHTTSRTLLQRIRSGGSDREVAWGEFQTRYEPLIRAYATSRGGKTHEVDDVVQDVMLAFFSAQSSFRYDPAAGRFRSYLYASTARALGRLRTRFAWDTNAGDDHLSSLEDPAAKAEWDALWEREQLKYGVEQLRKYYEDDATFQAFYRVAIEGIEPATVATQLGLSRDAVYKAHGRCLVRLRLVMEKLVEEDG